MKDKIKKLLEAIEHPGRFSDEELVDLLNDREVLELYRLMSKTADTLTDTSEPDIDNEWHRFEQKHSGTHDSVRRFSFLSRRNAAAVVIWVVASLAVVATALGVSYSFGFLKNSGDVDMKSGPVYEIIEMKGSPEPANVLIHEPQTITFKDESFDSIIQKIAGYYGASVTYRSKRTKDLRLYFQWNRSLPLEETVGQLNNFEQIKIGLYGNIMIIE